MGMFTLAKEALLLSAVLFAPLVFSTARQEEAKKPDDPPRGLKLREKGTFDGYTLFSPLLSRTTFLVDMDGKVVHEWKTEHAPGNSDYLLANGHLLRCKRIEDAPVFHGGGIGGGVQELDWDGKVLWDYTLATETQHHHHDIRPMPNGHILLIVWEKFTKDEAIARGRDPDQVGDEGQWPDAVYEIEPTRPDGAKIFWEWHVRDHLVQDRDAKKPAYGKLADHPELVDINAGRRTPHAETPEEKKKREEQEARMRGLGYAGGADDGQDAKGKHDRPAAAKPDDPRAGDARPGDAKPPRRRATARAHPMPTGSTRTPSTTTPSTTSSSSPRRVSRRSSSSTIRRRRPRRRRTRAGSADTVAISCGATATRRTTARAPIRTGASSVSTTRIGSPPVALEQDTFSSSTTATGARTASTRRSTSSSCPSMRSRASRARAARLTDRRSWPGRTRRREASTPTSSPARTDCRTATRSWSRAPTDASSR